MKHLNRFAWVIVVTASLTLSAWSLFTVGRSYGLPWPLASLVSTVFDGAALVSADLALRHARSHGDSGAASRMAVFVLAGLSGYLNSQHGQTVPARILFASPPVVAVVLFEFHTRWERRAALRKAGRVAEAVPPLGRLSFVMYPVRSVRAVRAIVGYRLDQRVRIETGGQVSAVNVRGVPGSVPTSAEVRAWARINGYRVADRGKVPAELVSAYRREYGLNGHTPVVTG